MLIHCFTSQIISMRDSWGHEQWQYQHKRLSRPSSLLCCSLPDVLYTSAQRHHTRQPIPQHLQPRNANGVYLSAAPWSRPRVLPHDALIAALLLPPAILRKPNWRQCYSTHATMDCKIMRIKRRQSQNKSVVEDNEEQKCLSVFLSLESALL